MIDNRVQLMGCKRGRPRPSASLLTAILRGCYIYLIRGRAEVGSRRLLHELLFLLADQMGYPLLSPIGERYGPIVAERKWAVFTPVGVNTIHTSHSSFQRSGIKGRGDHPHPRMIRTDYQYKLGGRRSWKRNQLTELFSGTLDGFPRIQRTLLSCLLYNRGVLSLEYFLREFFLLFWKNRRS